MNHLPISEGKMQNQVRKIVAAVSSLSKANPADPEVLKHVAALVESTEPQKAAIPTDELRAQIARLHKAAVTPAKNYSRIISIASGLDRAAVMARNSGPDMQRQIASLIQKVAGIFAECDTADELASHSLAEIEAAVHRLYNNGKQNDPHTYDFVQRGAGHHSK